MFNNYRHRAPPSPCSGSRGGAGAGAYAPSSEDGSPKSDFQKIKKDPRAGGGAPPQDTPNFKTLYIIYLCAPEGGEGHLAASGGGPQAAPSHPASSATLFAQTISHYRHPLPPPPLLPPPSLAVQAAGLAIRVSMGLQEPGPTRPQLWSDSSSSASRSHLKKVVTDFRATPLPCCSAGSLLLSQL